MPGDKIHKWHLPSAVQVMGLNQIGASFLYIGPLEISMLQRNMNQIEDKTAFESIISKQKQILVQISLSNISLKLQA